MRKTNNLDFESDHENGNLTWFQQQKPLHILFWSMVSKEWPMLQGLCEGYLTWV